MTTKSKAEALQKKCATELIAYCEGYCSTGGITCGPFFKTRIERIINDNLCLVELFEVVEKSYEVLQHCDTTTTGIFELQDALAALRAKLPKEVL